MRHQAHLISLSKKQILAILPCVILVYTFRYRVFLGISVVKPFILGYEHVYARSYPKMKHSSPRKLVGTGRKILEIRYGLTL
jgi:hypothetical protein